MQYFTPSLIERLSSSDDAAAKAARDEWEEALARYERYLQSIEAALPEHIREFNNLLLHDAVVWTITRQTNELSMVLRKDIPPQDVVLLTYRLIDEPFLNKNAVPVANRGPVMDFQYDEFELASENGGQVYYQDILFGNGWEMRLHFSDVRVSIASPVYPVPGTVLVPVASAIAKSA